MKDFKIEVPEGYEIDNENSSLEDGVIRFKEKKIKRNIITKIHINENPDNGHTYKFSSINNVPCFAIFEKSLHFPKWVNESYSQGASLALSNANGRWYDEDGNKIDGYLFFKPYNN